MKKRRMLSAVVGLGLGALATATAHSKTWTDVSGKHTVEAEFVSLADGKITLKTTTGKVTTFPLANLSAADRAFAEKLADAGAPAPVAGESKAEVNASLFEIIREDENGVRTSSHNLGIEVVLTGGAAAEAYAVGETVVEPIVIDGKSYTPEESFRIGDFETIDRSERAFSEHPEDGVRVDFDFGEVPAGAKVIDAVKGTVIVLAGGEAKTVSVDKLMTRDEAPIADPALAAAGLEMSFTRSVTDDDVEIGVTMKVGTKGFHALELVGADGKPVDTLGGGTMSNGSTVNHSINAAKADVENAVLNIVLRDGKEVELPFELNAVAIEKN